ncbi:hypothetical protein MB02_11750 [Croceicoccus estronivorus]|nr:hypothetical protein MB02_11750 [Croceicoccus estronivorus]
MYVSDLAASVHFYEALGFAVASGNHGHVEPQSGVRTLRNEQGIGLRLMRFPNPDGCTNRKRRPMTALGLTHLNFYVEDYDETLAAVSKRGGDIAAETRIAYMQDDSSMDMIYCTDPDGIRVEVWTTKPYGPGGFSSAVPGVRRKFSHSGICVRDLDQSIAFYQSLGFALDEVFDYRDPPGQLDLMFEEESSSAIAQMMRNGDDVIELLQFFNPAPRYVEEYAVPVRAGFYDLGFYVPSILEARSKLYGASQGWAEDQPVHNGSLRLLDPNGVRIELIEQKEGVL